MQVFALFKLRQLIGAGADKPADRFLAGVGFLYQPFGHDGGEILQVGEHVQGNQRRRLHRQPHGAVVHFGELRAGQIGFPWVETASQRFIDATTSSAVSG